MNEILSKKEVSSPRSGKAVTIAMQWAPNSPAWFYKYLDKEFGTFSLRQYGDQGCFSRLEIIDTPFTRFHNTIRVVYSDFRCHRLWIDLIDKAESLYKSGKTLLEAYNDTIVYILGELRASFQENNIPDPVWIRGAYWENPWHFISALSGFTSQDIVDFAVAPLGQSEKICLIGEAYYTDFSGWAEGAHLSSRNCLESRFNGSLASEIQKIFVARDAILLDDFAQLTSCPSVLSNEHCEETYGPYNLDGTLQQKFCLGHIGGNNVSSCLQYVPSDFILNYTEEIIGPDNATTTTSGITSATLTSTTSATTSTTSAATTSTTSATTTSTGTSTTCPSVTTTTTTCTCDVSHSSHTSWNFILALAILAITYLL